MILISDLMGKVLKGYEMQTCRLSSRCNWCYFAKDGPNQMDSFCMLNIWIPLDLLVQLSDFWKFMWPGFCINSYPICVPSPIFGWHQTPTHWKWKSKESIHPEVEHSTWTMDDWNTNFLLGWPIFRGYVSLRKVFFCNEYEPSELRAFPGRSTRMPLIFQIIGVFSLANSIQTLNQVDNVKPVSSNMFLLLQILPEFLGMSEVKPT